MHKVRNAKKKKLNSVVADQTIARNILLTDGSMNVEEPLRRITSFRYTKRIRDIWNQKFVVPWSAQLQCISRSAGRWPRRMGHMWPPFQIFFLDLHLSRPDHQLCFWFRRRRFDCQIKEPVSTDVLCGFLNRLHSQSDLLHYFLFSGNWIRPISWQSPCCSQLFFIFLVPFAFFHVPYLFVHFCELKKWINK